MLALSDHGGDISSQFFELFNRHGHPNLSVLLGKYLDLHLGPQHSIGVVCGQHHIDLPDTPNIAKSLPRKSHRIVRLIGDLGQFICIGVQQSNFGKVLRIHQVDLGSE